MLEAVVSDKCFLNGLVLLCYEFADGHGHAFFFGGGASRMEFDVECAYHGFQVSNLILLLFDKDSQHSYFLLHVLYLFSILLVLFFQLFE